MSSSALLLVATSSSSSSTISASSTFSSSEVFLVIFPFTTFDGDAITTSCISSSSLPSTYAESSSILSEDAAVFSLFSSAFSSFFADGAKRTVSFSLTVASGSSITDAVSVSES